MTTTSKNNSYVVILTHEGRAHYEGTSVGMLTQFFLDNNNIHTGVHTFVIDVNIDTRDRDVSITKHDNYSKTLCNVLSLRNVAYKSKSVMFILCHGGAKSEEHQSPPHLNFSEDDARNILYPCSGYSRDIWLHLVIKESKLVFLLCCNCDQIVSAYLQERNNDFPDIVYFNCGEVMEITQAIFVGCLIKIMDSAVIGRNPSDEELYTGVKQSVLGIMHIVRQCGDEYEFFDKLIRWGCISKYTTEKKKGGSGVAEVAFS